MDLICLSHLRWDFVYQRPQHLMSRFARNRRVFFIEEPVPDSATEYIEYNEREGVLVVKMHVPPGLDERAVEILQRRLTDQLLLEYGVTDYVLWYYSPMHFVFTRHLLQRAAAVVYDCMDELVNFADAPEELVAREKELFNWTDVVFTGGVTLYEHKRRFHFNVHAFPSSVDVAHFARARTQLPEPADQVDIPRPRLGYFGVVDERMDLDLLSGMAEMRPGWQFVIVGEVIKIKSASLPNNPNIHYLGLKRYSVLPDYLAGWDVAMLPFARNAATEYVSPTKIPEYIAGGKPVVSTSIRDVVGTYAADRLVEIADTPAEFVAAAESAMHSDADWLGRVDAFLANTSWDRTWSAMSGLVSDAVEDNLDNLTADSAAGGLTS